MGTAKVEPDAKGKPHLASDISTLAQVVKHFRLDRAFSSGLQKLILGIRKQKEAKSKLAEKAAPKKNGDNDTAGDRADKDGGRKRRRGDREDRRTVLPRS